MPNSKWVTPFTKQCFVTSGVALNMMGGGLVVGYAAILLPQLKETDSIIPIDDSMGSWLVAVVSIAFLVGNLIIPSIMSKYGRKRANLLCAIPILSGWLLSAFAKSFWVLLLARFLQGITMGMNTPLGSLLIGEYTSPKHRGALLSAMSFTISTGILLVQALGFTYRWKITALLCASVCIMNILIIFKSPESPSWLASQGRYEECREVFQWLRDDSENAELEGLIQAAKINRASKVQVQSVTMLRKVTRTWHNLNVAIRKKEFYKPVILMIHLNSLLQWSGILILSSYAVYIYERVIGLESNIPFLIFTANLQRLIANFLAMFVIERVKRRTMVITICLINIAAFFGTAGYVYAKIHGYIQGHVIVGIILIHIHMFSIGIGILPIAGVIAGEVFPLKHRSEASAISTLWYSPNMFVITKTLPYLLETLGLHGAYCLYGGIVTYCFAVTISLLPETKNRTLQDIEEEFRGEPLSAEEAKSVQSLNEYELKHRTAIRYSISSL